MEALQRDPKQSRKWIILVGVLLKAHVDISMTACEAILKLRSIHSSGDFDKYWTFYQQKSKKRLHDGFGEGIDLGKVV